MAVSICRTFYSSSISFVLNMSGVLPIDIYLRNRIFLSLSKSYGKFSNVNVDVRTKFFDKIPVWTFPNIKIVSSSINDFVIHTDGSKYSYYVYNIVLVDLDIGNFSTLINNNYSIKNFNKFCKVVMISSAAKYYL